METTLRLSFFLGLFVAIAFVEHFRPSQTRRVAKYQRWFDNIVLISLGNVTARLVLPFSTISVAALTQSNQWGLLHWVPVSPPASIAISLVLLDLLIYLQHVAFHRVPLLWRLHSAHHLDLDIDVTTGFRMHPLEILVSILIKCVAIIVLGIPILAVIIFEIILNSTALFCHSNIKLSPSLDAKLRRLMVTPDMHLIHHSSIIHEEHSNYGFNLSIWDRWFSTYRAQPKSSLNDMQIGLAQVQDPSKTRLGHALLAPFTRHLTR